MSENLTPIIITYCTDPAHPGLANLKKSADYWGWPIDVVVDDEWRGFGRKLKRVLRRGYELATHGYSHMISLDAYDSLVVGHKCAFERSLSKFFDSQNRLLFATEMNCWPDNSMKDHELYKDQSSLWRYTHSPFVLDIRKPKIDGFGDIDDGYDDQLHAHNIYLYGHQGVGIDRGCHVFQSIAFCHPYDHYFTTETGRKAFCLKNKICDSTPFFAHGNGQTDMSWLIPFATGEKNV